MAASNTGLLNLERELVCFICTEILYQPLTLIDCLHSFCGACLKEWFSHQHRKATSSHSSSSSSNPYTCPTCRGPVKDAQQHAFVNTLLDMFLTANPGRTRSEEERREFEQIYKPGDNVMPKVEGRRRERRARRGDDDAVEARERRMIEEARERSLRDVHGSPSVSQDTLHVPTNDRQSQSSRSRERENRRERRREQERSEQRHDQRQRSRNSDVARASNGPVDEEQRRRESLSAAAPSSSPRNPEAVEARRRQQTVAHQASLTSLISSSDSGTGSSGTNDSLNEARIMQEILAEGLGLPEGIDVERMTESEQDTLAKRIAEAYHQRRRERNQRNNQSSEARNTTPSTDTNSPSARSHTYDDRHHQRTDSDGRQRRAGTLPARPEDHIGEPVRSPRTRPAESAATLPPTAPVVVTHRRRASSQDQQRNRSQNAPRASSPSARSGGSRAQTTFHIEHRSQSHDRVNGRRADTVSDIAYRQVTEPTGSAQRTGHQGQVRPDPVISGEANGVIIGSPTAVTSEQHTSPRQHVAELAGCEGPLTAPVRQPPSQGATQIPRRASGLYDEPSISCFQCHRWDIQYEVYKHCDRCDVDLCLPCYRTGRGCQHWYGFGYSAMSHFQSRHPTSYEQIELPHNLQHGRQYQKPEDLAVIRSKLAKDGKTRIPLQSTSNPATRLLEGRFCDRCSAPANSEFWLCNQCNHGEWGFCRNCVNTHHCCTHPLLPIAHKLHAPASPTTGAVADRMNPRSGELLSATLGVSPVPSQPSSATSAVSMMTGPFPDWINLNITTSCDICEKPIPWSAYRFHCPEHRSVKRNNLETKGDYDLCTPCYQNLIKTNRIQREDGTAGWRKCPSGHRMIVTNFVADPEGGRRRVVANDLVGGLKSEEEAMEAWMQELERANEEPKREGDGPPAASSDPSIARRHVHTRTNSYPESSSPFTSGSRFPPDGGTGLRGLAMWPVVPPPSIPSGRDEAGGVQQPEELTIPVGAEIREIKIDEEMPHWCGGVYAGDRGLIPVGYLKILP